MHLCTHSCFNHFTNIPNIKYKKIVLICVLGMVGTVACRGREPRQGGIERVKSQKFKCCD